MQFDATFLIISIIKIAGVILYIYGLLWILGHPSKWIKIVGMLVAFGAIQFALSFQTDGFQLLNDFDRGLLFQSVGMAMVALGLNLIYGFNGQFSLGQWGFYGIGAYTAADVAYRWTSNDTRGLIGVAVGSLLVGAAIWLITRLVRRYKGMPVLSQFTLYLVASFIGCVIAMIIANAVDPALQPFFGTTDAPGPFRSDLALQIVFLFSILLAGAVAAISSFLFGLPVLSLGSDYFGIATLGFVIVVNTLMVNSDTILPFPEMKGGRGMVDIPQIGVTAWFWGFIFMVLTIIVMRNLVYSTTGRAIVSVREDETAAKVMGIDVAGYKLLAFIVGSIFAGVGGAIYVFTTGTGFLSPKSFDFLTGFNPLIIVVFGGLGSMTGTIAASFGWTFFLEGLLRVILGQFGTEAPQWRYVLYPITLLLVMLLRPQGLLGNIEWGFLRSRRFQVRAPLEAVEQTTIPAATSK